MNNFGSQNHDETANRTAQAAQNNNQTRKRTYIAKAGMALIMCASIGRMSAQSEAVPFVPFSQFIARTTTTFASSSLPPKSGFSSRPVVVDQTAFEQMRGHILDLYQGVQVRHSYVLGAQTFDCIPVEQQSSVRLLGGQSIASAPPPMTAPAIDSAAAERPVGQSAVALPELQASGNDTFGNAIGCEANTIPMLRVTLEDMTRFSTLDEFFSKGPNGAGRPAAPLADDSGSAASLKSRPNSELALASDTEVVPGLDVHKHAYTHQVVKNLGGKSLLNLWSPYVADFLGEDFSLSQQWFIGYGGGTVQTVEAGWQNYPAKYGSQNPALFIYSTRDNYRAPAKGEATVGCYNLDCGIFVQVSNAYALGSRLGSYSLPYGPQYELPIQWLLYAGNWWLNVNGTWIGYYPGSFYRGGQLSRNATDIEFGGEAASDPHNGAYYYAPMGSGAWANTWWQHAAYQRGIWYTDTANNNQWANMTSATEAASCYSVDGPHYEASTWGIYFFFGGPGGFCK